MTSPRRRPLREFMWAAAFTIIVCAGLATSWMAAGSTVLDPEHAAAIFGGSDCYNVFTEECDVMPKACGDIKCIRNPVTWDWECPPFSKGATNYKENFTQCVIDPNGDYEKQVDDDDFYCWQSAFCRLFPCIPSTDGNWYCAVGPNTPKDDDASRKLRKKCIQDGDRCPEQKTY